MRSLRIRYFAAAAEAAGTDEELWPHELRPESSTLAELRLALTEKYGGAMARVLGAGSFLIDGTVRRDDGPILREPRASDASPDASVTVDVLPPFAGG